MFDQGSTSLKQSGDLALAGSPRPIGVQILTLVRDVAGDGTGIEPVGLAPLCYLGGRVFSQRSMAFFSLPIVVTGGEASGSTGW